MKKWIKTHSKALVIILAVILIAIAIYGFIVSTEAWQFIIYSISFSFWVTVLLWVTGVVNKIGEWWDKE